MSKIKVRITEFEVEYLEELDADSQLFAGPWTGELLEKFSSATSIELQPTSTPAAPTDDTEPDEEPDDEAEDEHEADDDESDDAPESEPATPPQRSRAKSTDKGEQNISDCIVLAYSKQHDVKAADLAEDLYGQRSGPYTARIYNHVSRLVAEGRLERTGRGCYQPTGRG